LEFNHTRLAKQGAAVAESEEADLVRDVCLDVDKAQTTLARHRGH
jgi:hypothetical protein